MTEGTSVQFLAGVAILEIQDGIWKKPKRDDEIRFLFRDGLGYLEVSQDFDAR